MDLKAIEGNADGKTRERISGQTINETCDWCEEDIESEKCINMQEMHKRWNEDLERSDETQKKAMRKWNE